MSTLLFGTKSLPGRQLRPASAFPAIRDPITFSVRTALDEDDGLFIGYGMFTDSLPYTMQDDYDGSTQPLTFACAVLENEWLRAEFVLDLGGRLWSLYDKAAKRDLLSNNREFLPCNLAIRNAWCAGGVEWNFARRGHDAQTCSPRFAAALKDDDGTPVLRIYEFSRDRVTPFQIDFFLPDDSRFLFARTRISNTNDHVVPMYWWSNIAVPERPGCRLIVPAMESYANAYLHGAHSLAKIPMPDGEGFDASYPCNFRNAKDHFYKIPDTHRKYETVLYEDGYGLIECSTRRLQGRKLFVWGQNTGGQRWQRKLLDKDSPNYLEIQAGLAKTQQECLPMPPKTTWEWLEAYGAIQLNPSEVFGSWENAVNAVTRKLDAMLPEAQLDEMLARTRQSIALKPAAAVHYGSGWAALEERRRGASLTHHLDFGSCGPEQQEWLELLEHGCMDDEPPRSFMVQDEWFNLLKKAVENHPQSWKIHYHLALNYFRRQDLERANAAIDASIACHRSAWNLHAKAYLRRASGHKEEVVELLLEALALRPNDTSLLKESSKTLMECQAYAPLAALMQSLDKSLRQQASVRLIDAQALAYTGHLDEAEAILDTLDVDDLPGIREGDISLAKLYVYVQCQKAARDGRTLNPSDVVVPARLDLRMST